MPIIKPKFEPGNIVSVKVGLHGNYATPRAVILGKYTMYASLDWLYISEDWFLRGDFDHKNYAHETDFALLEVGTPPGFKLHDTVRYRGRKETEVITTYAMLTEIKKSWWLWELLTREVPPIKKLFLETLYGKPFKELVKAGVVNDTGCILDKEKLRSLESWEDLLK